MPIILGPILYAEPCLNDVWKFLVGALATDGVPPTVSVSVQANPGPASRATIGAPVTVRSFAAGQLVPACTFYTIEVSIPQTATEQKAAYTLTDAAGNEIKKDCVYVPAAGAPPRMAFFSCNGVDDPSRFHGIADTDALWKGLLERQTHHAPPASFQNDPVCPYNLLIGGGDQVYCDSIWHTNAFLDEWRRKPLAARLQPLAPAQRAQLHAELIQEYLSVYVKRWMSSACHEVMARLPGIYMWDDHDIFDGWGSHEALQQCDVFQTMFEAARVAFQTFQLAGLTSGRLIHPAAGHYAQALPIGGDVALVLLDLRTDRTPNLVISTAQKQDLQAWMGALAGFKHVFVVSTIPIIYRGFGAAEGILRLVPGIQEIEDDLRDQWESPAHHAERSWLIMNLLAWSKDARCRISVLSGDVHCASQGRITSRRPVHLLPPELEVVISQATSSAIVFPPPGGLAQAALALVGNDKPHEDPAGVETRVVPMVPPSKTMVYARNWLSVEPDVPWDAGRVWLRWIFEGNTAVKPLVVDPRA